MLIDMIIDIIAMIGTVLTLIVLLGYVTKKRFIGPCSVKKNIVLVLFSIFFSPVSVFLASIYSWGPGSEILNHFNVYDRLGVNHLVLNEILMVLNEFVILSLVILLYVLLCGRKNISLAIFVYLMIYMLVMILFYLFLFTDASSHLYKILTTTAMYTLFAMFYLLVVRPLLKIDTEDRNVNQPVFVYLPVVTIIFIGVINHMSQLNMDMEASPLAKEKSIQFLSIISNICILFIGFLMIVAFNVILKNVSQIHETLHQKDIAEKTKDELKDLSVEVMEALAHTIDAKDEYTKGHSIRVANYSRMIAQKMDMPEEDCDNIYYMGLLHDIGKIGVPNEIINKPTRLTDDEYTVIKKHPPLGYDILSEIKSRPDLSIGARWHHERFDGKGYPDRKERDEIPLAARIIAVADCYDAMTSNRSYRQYLPQDVVKAEIEKNSGTQFDPEVAKYMIAIIEGDHEYVLHE